MTNRIKRLVYERERAVKITEFMTTKAEKLLAARDRNERSLQEKLEI